MLYVVYNVFVIKIKLSYKLFDCALEEVWILFKFLRIKTHGHETVRARTWVLLMIKQGNEPRVQLVTKASVLCDGWPAL